MGGALGHPATITARTMGDGAAAWVRVGGAAAVGEARTVTLPPLGG